ncbi:MAG: acyloxyacyl hydrolase [Tannerella sp.]|jgi:hypothetical protein|nr:acyloxyacyl hydrolase [Tannerella sp.]
MKGKRQLWKVIIIPVLMLFISDKLPAEERCLWKLKMNNAETASTVSDDTCISSENLPDNDVAGRFIHTIGIEARPGHVLRTNPFLQGVNENMRPVKNSMSAHLNYSFRPQPDSYTGRIFGGVYQGIGFAYFTFGESRQIGNPVAFYLFQGARLNSICDRLSLNHEWNFGLSAGWKPYDPSDNYYNIIIGSKVNAYINLNIYLSWMLSRRLELTSGIAMSHFSNGNTRFPNAGLNTASLKAGLVCHFNSKKRFLPVISFRPPIPEFPRHISYDILLFGSLRRKGLAIGEDRIALPNAYTVLGFNFSPMYNLSYRFRAGMSLDGFYDGSANIYFRDYADGTRLTLIKPPIDEQSTLGFSGRTEYVMPYFSVNLGLGVNVFHSGGDIKGFYQILALKIKFTRNSFIHIGYSLQNFNAPNFLMLGVGYRFNNKYPVFPR